MAAACFFVTFMAELLLLLIIIKKRFDIMLQCDIRFALAPLCLPSAWLAKHAGSATRG